MSLEGRLNEIGSDPTANKLRYIHYDTVTQASLTDPDGIIDDTDLTNAAISVDVQPDIARNLIINISNGAGTATHLTAGGIVTVVGFDVNYEAITEVFTFAEIPDSDNEIVVGTKAFLVITTVTASNWVGLGGSSDEKIDVGGGNTFALPTSKKGGLKAVRVAKAGNVAEAVGTVDTDANTIIPTTLSSAGAVNYAFWYEYV